MCQLMIFLALTSFKACHSQGESKARPEVRVNDATGTTTAVGQGIASESHGSSGSAQDPGHHRNRTTTISDIQPSILCPWSRHARRHLRNETEPPDFSKRHNTTVTDHHHHHHHHDDNDTQTSDDSNGPDLTSLFSSPFPGDVLEDAEIAELFRQSVIWTNSRQLNKKLKPYRRRIVSQGLVSRKTYRRFSKAILLLVVIFIVVGFVTNVLALKAFRRLGRSVTNTYMICLCCFDIAFLVFVVCSIVAQEVARRVTLVQSVAGHYLWLCDFMHFLLFSARQVVIMTTAFMSLDRYFSFASLFKARRTSPLRRPRLLVGLCCLLVLALNCHMLLKRQVKCGRVEGISRPVCYLTYSALYLRHRTLLDDLAIVGSCLFQYCPLLAMVVANLSLMVSLHRYSGTVRASICSENHGAVKGDRPGNQPRDSVSTISSSVASTEKVTSRRQFFCLEKGKCVTVIVYSLLFFVLALPLALLPVLKKAIPDFNVLKPQHYVFLMYVRSFNLLDTISASINFLVFFVKGGAFRATVLNMLRCRRLCCKRGVFSLRGPGKTPSSGKSGGRVWPCVCMDNTLYAVVLRRSLVRREKADSGGC